MDTRTKTFVPLWVKSNYSFLRASSHPEELVAEAARLGMQCMALTDRKGMYGVVRAHSEAKRFGVKLLIGAEVEVYPPLHLSQIRVRKTIGYPTNRKAEISAQEEESPTPTRLLLLAATRSAYGRICRLLSQGFAQGTQKGDVYLSFDDLHAFADEVIALCPDAHGLQAAHEVFGNRLYAVVSRTHSLGEREREMRMRQEAAMLGVPTVAACEVLYHDVNRKPLLDVLQCIDAKVRIQEAGTLLKPNRENGLKAYAEMAELFADDLDSLHRTVQVAERCDFSLSEIRYRYPQEKIPEGISQPSFLRQKAMEGALRRYPPSRYPDGIPTKVIELLEKELTLISELEYDGYFLTMWDVVRFCHEQKILCQGRGSAANSAVCYCLGVTALDPSETHLLFERFLSRERAEAPDIDLDIEHERREEVIQYVYRRWGTKHAAMVANVIRYRAKSALRDVGKVFGISELVLNRASKELSHYDTLEGKELQGLQIDPTKLRQLLALCSQIQNFPRHLSIHPGGFILGHEPVDSLVPIEPATMKDRTVIQWDKYDVEELGLFKVDLLGLGGLSMIRRALSMINEVAPSPLEMATIPQEDAKTYEMICSGDTVGVFQIESRAQMSMLPRLRPKTFYDLVIEVAIVRPGPIQGGMVHPYLKRKQGIEKPSYPHDRFREVLGRTLGVPIFQEQVMEMAMVAGYTGGEADQLRRDMAAWKSSGRIENHHEKFVAKMVASGVEHEYAERVFDQIRGFGEYGFPESHAASFALITYVTSWIKCHYPAEFACALLNAWPMGFYAPSTIVEDAKRHGVEVLPIDLEQSDFDCSMEVSRGVYPRAIRMGLKYVKGLSESEAQVLLSERACKPFASIEDVEARTGLSQRAMRFLAEAGAFRAMQKNRREAYWTSKGLERTGAQQAMWFRTDAAHRRTNFRPLDAKEEVAWDYLRSMHSTSAHPMIFHRNFFASRNVLASSDLMHAEAGKSIEYAGVVICRQRPQTATGILFMTLEDETGFANLVVFTDVFARFELIARTAVLLWVRAEVQRESGVVHLIVKDMRDVGADALEVQSDGAMPYSRDFH